MPPVSVLRKKLSCLTQMEISSRDSREFEKEIPQIGLFRSLTTAVSSWPGHSHGPPTAAVCLPCSACSSLVRSHSGSGCCLAWRLSAARKPPPSEVRIKIQIMGPTWTNIFWVLLRRSRVFMSWCTDLTHVQLDLDRLCSFVVTPQKDAKKFFQHASSMMFSPQVPGFQLCYDCRVLYNSDPSSHLECHRQRHYPTPRPRA